MKLKQRSKLIALPLATALALAILMPSLALSPSAPPQADPAQAATSTPVPLKAVSTDDLAKVKSTGKLLVGVSADYPPYEYYDSNFKIDGFDPALIRDLGRRIGAKEVELSDFAFEGLLTALRLGQVDVAISAIAVTSERRDLVDFTNVYFIGADAVLAARRYPADKLGSLNELANKRVAAQRGTVYASFLQKNLVDKGLAKATDIFLYQDIDAAIRDLKAGKFDLLMMDRLPARNFAKSDAELKVVGEGFTPERFAIAVRRGSNLRAALNDALVKAQNDGTVAKLISQYLKLNPNEVEPIPTPGTTTSTVTPLGGEVTGGCVFGATYVTDLNVPDGTQFQPGQSFQKGWRLQNSGNCDWQPNFFLGFAFGNTPAARMGGQPTQIGRVVKPGGTADVNVNLVAPGLPGTYQGFWQMYDANGVPFGARVWVQIVVPGAPTPVPPPPPTPIPGISFSANPTV
ncbi:MAG: transporter substrate-binding domain-containing protein, partial [Candidatus Brachytrichaceae bacterium NZ_4S206]